MANLTHSINDESGTQDSNGNEASQVNRKAYTVAEGREVLKNGKTYKSGDQVELDEGTARNFANAGDIEGEFENEK